MKTQRALMTVAVVLTVVALALAQQAPRGGGAGAPQGGAAPAGAARGPAAAPMALTTTGWMDGAVIPNKFTQAAPMAVSPALTWTNTPMGTQSFVLHFHDPDVSITRGTGDQVHWLVWNIPATTTSFPEGAQAIRSGILSRNHGMLARSLCPGSAITLIIPAGTIGHPT